MSSGAEGGSAGVVGVDGNLAALSRHNAPMGKVLRTPLNRPNVAEAKTVVPESKAVIEQILPTGSRLYVHDIVGGPSQIRIFDLEGRPQGLVPVQQVPTVSHPFRIRRH